MIKDKEWLKDEIIKLSNQKTILTGEELVKGPKIFSTTVLRLIDQLEDSEITEKKAWELVSGEKGLGAKYHEQLYKTVINLWYEDKEGYTLFEFNKEVIERFNKSKKSVIPQCVADWIEGNRQSEEPWSNYTKEDALNDSVHFTIYGLFANYPSTNEHVELRKPVEDWLELCRSNYFTLVDAVRYGYEVEKERLYHVLNNDNEVILWKPEDCIRPALGVPVEMTNVLKEYQLTEKEIKDYDERFWQFAEPVEEVTE